MIVLNRESIIEGLIEIRKEEDLENSIIVNNIKSIISNLHPTSLDSDLFRIMNVNDNATKFILNKLLLDTDKNYFVDMSYKYIDYYELN